MAGQRHPYVPEDLELNEYVPGLLSQSTILSVYGLASLVVISLVWLFSDFRSFESKFCKEETAHYLAEVWKEYSKGDSRYAAGDAGVVAVEGLTAVIEGPASLLAVYAIATGKSYSCILQFAISLGQLYGTAVYFVTSYLEGKNFSASPFYYYAYYIGENASWVVIPSLISIHCWKTTCTTFQVQVQKKSKSH